jgi:hypothetical protein
MSDLTRIELADPHFLTSLAVTTVVPIISVGLIRRIPLCPSLPSRARLVGALAILDLCEFFFFFRAVRSEPYFLVNLVVTVVIPTILFYVAAFSLVLRVFQVLRGAFELSSISAFAVMGQLWIWVIKVAFAAAYASPAGCILAGLHLIVNLAKWLAVRRVKNADKVKAKEE